MITLRHRRICVMLDGKRSRENKRKMKELKKMGMT